MSNQTRPFATQSTHHDTAQSTRSVAKFLTATLLGGSSLVLSGLTLTGTVLGLAVATPLFVLFSPVLVPALIATLMIITGFLFTGGSGTVAIMGFAWLYKYITGEHPVGADEIDYMRDEVGGKARDMKDFVKDYAKAGQNRAENDVRRT